MKTQSVHYYSGLLNRRAAWRGVAASAAALALARHETRGAETGMSPTLEELLRQADGPVLKTDFLATPVKVEAIELLKSGAHFLVRARSADGVEVVTVPHQGKMPLAAPLLLKNVVPGFLGRDARTLEALQWETYRRGSNYKLQGLLYGVAVMAVEQALLELMARTARRPLADFFGGAVRREVPVYFASGNRGNPPEAEIEHLQRLAADSGAKALKLRLGARMSRNADAPPRRSESLIPLARHSFGDGFTLYADANSSYDAAEAIRIGRLLEEHRYGFFEEPCEFDDLWSTQAVADALNIPVALGEQEYSLHRWRWCIAARACDIVQPDLHYGGGFIGAVKVARMAAAAGLTVVPHMSGGGLGYVDVVHFASFTPNIGPHMEYKGNTDLPVACDTSSLKCEDGIVRCPTGVGFGVTIDPDLFQRAEVVRL